ncbi:PfkB family carbohydrate kinase [Cellulomonas fimi]|uniref:Cytidyltransferase-related domain protein n=1 Tax=Cellulomonas fimi (strain ATCC 484 / DSM 20113 / JCM 1341 / CCUG 24087 / LMG 16345 / NBRC 15513 / NCIMB 8980 / NCTC 7547 / NRS-133) TaxID=590998 RepID=F4H5Z2_CELFA|nr:PfkB family carbohydrate kinase [Cellulomonas fimi]AEE46722.1 cytidyltransferase-related domain protein [Cellulomonas fimi ATCC 484]NNH07633.1 bifunctional heptose 7-phosphate kinase/heptose 1-phosphate adenyltransferase [Cellulomonas fimi]VEH33988.1 Bifunctional protein hldE [Cellulomonas fimi]
MTAGPRVVVVGDAVLDRDVVGRTDRLCPDAPAPVLDVTATRSSPGGAGLAALLCAASGARVTLVAPVADDDDGAELVAGLGGVDVLRLDHDGATRTKTRVRAGGTSLVRIDAGGPGTPSHVPVDALRTLLASADAVLVSDYGAGTTHDPRVRTLLTAAARTTPTVWDPHPRGAVPVEGCALVTPNAAEARHALGGIDGTADALPGPLRTVWRAAAVAVTAGERGAYLARDDDATTFVPAPVTRDGDPCGAGDRFAATAVVALARGADVVPAVVAAVAEASSWVGAGGCEGFRARTRAGDARAHDGRPADVRDDATREDGDVGVETVDAAAARLRGRGRLVATGGCYDLLHAGHVATLQAARRLGDALVVLLNSDDSVRRLKGPTRPVVDAADRARVLLALDCVDAVVVFDEDDPRAALARLRPDVWAKGGDYGGARLPEADVVRAGGGRVVLLPYLDGRSTTGMLARSSR